LTILKENSQLVEKFEKEENKNDGEVQFSYLKDFNEIK